MGETELYRATTSLVWPGFIGANGIKNGRARIWKNKKYKHLGYFTKFKDAVAARKAAEQKYGFHPNHGMDDETWEMLYG
jgi:hypothetical protein